jgi:hypothetical protein
MADVEWDLVLTWPYFKNRLSFQNSTKVLIKDEKLQGEGGEFTKNVVFINILLSHHMSFLRF